MRLHRRLLLTRFGLLSILPMAWIVAVGIAGYAIAWPQAVASHGGAHGIAIALFPLTWIAAVSLLGTISALHHRKAWLVVLAPFAVLYVLLSYAIWLLHGVRGLVTGREPARDKPTRVAHVVE